LLEESGTFAVRDAVEDRFCFGHRLDIVDNRMSCLENVGVDALEFAAHEINPAVSEASELRSLSHHEIRHIGCKGLVEPEIIPPFHRDQVAKPLVSQLVQIRVRERQLVIQGHGRPSPQIVLSVGHACNVLHRAGVELGHEDLIVLTELVRHSE